MPYPDQADKHLGRPYVTPHRLLENLPPAPGGGSVAPGRMILAWQRPLLERLASSRALEPLPGTAALLLGLAGTPPAVFRLPSGVGFALLPIGAPTVGIVVEELAALGVQSLVGIGYAGGLGAGLSPGDLVVCSRALRDEGTSHHYAPPGRFAFPDRQLTEALETGIARARTGPGWTTDAPYRETLEEIDRLRAEGVMTVDMEAAALFSVSGALGVKAASVFCVSDTLHGPAWEPHFAAVDVEAALWELFEAVEGCLAGPATQP